MRHWLCDAPPSIAAGLLTLAAIAVAASPAHAQVWVAPAGTGAVTLYTQVIDNTGHRLTDGYLLKDGKSTTAAMYVEAEYALTDRLSFSLGLPYVFAKYRGPGPSLANLPVDQCKCWHSGWQDVGGTVRFNLINGRVALTPSVSFGVPSRTYEFEGEAVVGFGLEELRLALDGGARLDPISPKLVVQARYSYAFVEQVLDLPHDRSNASLELDYQFTPRFSARALVLWQRTHGGLRVGSITGNPFPPPGELNTPERFKQHDRLLRDNNSRLGVSASYSFDRFAIFGAYLHLMDGTDTHAGRAFAVGTTWPFELGR